MKNHKVFSLRTFYRLDYETCLQWLAEGCALCGLPFEVTPDVDHDHSCDHPDKGRSSCRACVRGLVHRGCNLRIAAYEHRPVMTADILAYLNRHKARKAAS